MTDAPNPLREIRDALSFLMEVHDHANKDAFKNGVTDQTGTLDEGDVIAASAYGDARRALALIDALEPLEGLNQKALFHALTEGDEAIVTGLGRGKDYDEAAKIGMRAAIAAYISHLKDPHND